MHQVYDAARNLGLVLLFPAVQFHDAARNLDLFVVIPVVLFIVAFSCTKFMTQRATWA